MKIGILLFFLGLAYGEEHTISQKDKAFSVKSLKAKMGDTITFKNDDPFQHNVYSLSPGNAFELKIQEAKGKKGDSSTIKLEAGKFKPGTMEVECAIHPAMKVKIEITE